MKYLLLIAFCFFQSIAVLAQSENRIEKVLKDRLEVTFNVPAEWNRYENDKSVTFGETEESATLIVQIEKAEIINSVFQDYLNGEDYGTGFEFSSYVEELTSNVSAVNFKLRSEGYIFKGYLVKYLDASGNGALIYAMGNSDNETTAYGVWSSLKFKVVPLNLDNIPLASGKLHVLTEKPVLLAFNEAEENWLNEFTENKNYVKIISEDFWSNPLPVYLRESGFHNELKKIGEKEEFGNGVNGCLFRKVEYYRGKIEDQYDVYVITKNHVSGYTALIYSTGSDNRENALKVLKSIEFPLKKKEREDRSINYMFNSIDQWKNYFNNKHARAEHSRMLGGLANIVYTNIYFCPDGQFFYKENGETFSGSGSTIYGSKDWITGTWKVTHRENKFGIDFSSVEGDLLNGLKLQELNKKTLTEGNNDQGGSQKWEVSEIECF